MTEIRKIGKSGRVIILRKPDRITMKGRKRSGKRLAGGG